VVKWRVFPERKRTLPGVRHFQENLPARASMNEINDSARLLAGKAL
jgi:hypothetical protein